MTLIELYPSFYGLYIKNHSGEEQLYIQEDISLNSNRCHLDLFESPEVMQRWVEKEREIFKADEHWGMYEIYERLYSKKIYSTEFQKLIREKEEIDSISIVANKGGRRLYFRDDFIDGYDSLIVPSQKLHAKEPIYIINQYKELAEQNVVQKESYFVTYPIVSTPLFSAGITEWAEELIQRKPDQDYYIEQTTFAELYMLLDLQVKDSNLFILCRENAPHYILRKSDIENIVNGTFDM